MPDIETFYRDYVAQRKPVIITNLFEGEPIRQIQILEDALKAFGDVQINVRSEYSSGLDAQSRIMTFKEYWDFVEANPSSKMLCTEYEIPARLMTMFKLPAVCTVPVDDVEEILGLPKKYG